MMGIVVPETCWASNKIWNWNHMLHLVGILFPHINDDARSKSHQMDIPISYQKNIIIIITTTTTFAITTRNHKTYFTKNVASKESA
jgi:hypothetical protein